MALPAFLPDFFPLTRAVLFRLDAEAAHNMTIRLMKRGLTPRFDGAAHPLLRTNVAGLDFPNPVGMAAGFDKQGEVIPEMLDMGFGFVEIGSITPKPQAGNPAPRVFRLPAQEAVINRYGFNSEGFDVCFRRVAAWYDTCAKTHMDATDRAPRGILGVNIGKNKDGNATQDYTRGVKKFRTCSDYITINISSPNTPGLRDLQGRASLNALVQEVLAARVAKDRALPIFIKIAPDQTEQSMRDIADVAVDSKVDGIIIGNTTTTRLKNLPPQFAKEAGGLSGKPLFELSTAMLANLYRMTGGKIPLIGCGGVASGADAYTKIRSGASLVQLYTALVYQGPYLVPRILRELATLLERDGFTSVSAAVGVDVK